MSDDRPSVWSDGTPIEPPAGADHDVASTTPPAHPGPTRRVTPSRRSVLRWGGATALGVGAVAMVARLASSSTSNGASGSSSPSDITLPPTAATLPNQLAPVADATSFDIDGLSPLITPTADFFRVDIAAGVPSVDLSTWRLHIGGHVRESISFSFDDLLAMPQITAPITLACVSNRIGGDLVGTAVWQGVELRTILERAGVADGGEQIVGRSVDGFTAGFPTSCAFDGRTAMVAIGMNGAPLPHDHGFPARLVVEGLYGYVSSTKWLSSIDLRGWNEVNGYWIPLGWSKEGPILMSSRIDVPREGEVAHAGDVVLAGVAWAPDAGVASVEIRVDGGAWRTCDLGPELSGGVWRQWRTVWTTPPGTYEIEVRCTDRRGAVQTAVETPDPIAGRTGHHTRMINVR